MESKKDAIIAKTDNAERVDNLIASINDDPPSIMKCMDPEKEKPVDVMVLNNIPEMCVVEIVSSGKVFQVPAGNLWSEQCNIDPQE